MGTQRPLTPPNFSAFGTSPYECFHDVEQCQMQHLLFKRRWLSRVPGRQSSPGLGGALPLHSPLLPLILRVIRKLLTETMSAILIAPWWPRQNWFLMLFRLSGKLPLISSNLGENYHWRKLPLISSNLLLLSGENIYHHDMPSLALTT